jgi:hypothetical protein
MALPSRKSEAGRRHAIFRRPDFKTSAFNRSATLPQRGWGKASRSVSRRSAGIVSGDRPTAGRGADYIEELVGGSIEVRSNR